ncbi:addiction module protein [Algoriphagus sp. H41]|uniref:Addiction module protein n=1 Tax=Algoriphagus oliviformis TaxID=2811231 RepID=A0ABS3C1A7_9BACT|nr:addiction module protein [Algoriphagus oliviformis]MBN7810690.1 addiction module protein [Algoriphagus oliviformis]
MDLQAIKLDLIQWLATLQDRSVLEQLQAFKQQQKNGLSESHKALLDERIESYQSNPGNVRDWEDVMDEIEKNL